MTANFPGAVRERLPKKIRMTKKSLQEKKIGTGISRNICQILRPEASAKGKVEEGSPISIGEGLRAGKSRLDKERAQIND